METLSIEQQDLLMAFEKWINEVEAMKEFERMLEDETSAHIVKGAA